MMNDDGKSPTYVLKCNREWQKVTITETHSNWHGREYRSYMEVGIEFDVETMDIKGFNYRIMTTPNDTLARWTSKPAESMTKRSLAAAERWLSNLIRMNIMMVMNIGRKSRQYKAILNEAFNQGMPQNFLTDLIFHDAFRIARYHPKQFMWFLRKSGTWLFIPREYGGTLYNHTKDMSYQDSIQYTWDGYNLLKLEATQ